MQVSLEISLYPLDSNYIPSIDEFISYLNDFPNLVVKTNSMSTQVFGTFLEVCQAVNLAMEKTIKKANTEHKKLVFVTKLVNTDLNS